MHGQREESVHHGIPGRREGGHSREGCIPTRVQGGAYPGSTPPTMVRVVHPAWSRVWYPAWSRVWYPAWSRVYLSGCTYTTGYTPRDAHIPPGYSPWRTLPTPGIAHGAPYQHPGYTPRMLYIPPGLYLSDAVYTTRVYFPVCPTVAYISLYASLCDQQWCTLPYMPPTYPFHCWARFRAQNPSEPLRTLTLWRIKTDLARYSQFYQECED